MVFKRTIVEFRSHFKDNYCLLIVLKFLFVCLVLAFLLFLKRKVLEHRTTLFTKSLNVKHEVIIPKGRLQKKNHLFF